MVFCDCIFSHQEFLLTYDLKKWPSCKRWAWYLCMQTLQHLSILFNQKQCHFYLYMAFYVISLLLYLIDPATQDNKAHRKDVEMPLSRHSWKCSSPPRAEAALGCLSSQLGTLYLHAQGPMPQSFMSSSVGNRVYLLIFNS